MLIFYEVFFDTFKKNIYTTKEILVNTLNAQWFKSFRQWSTGYLDKFKKSHFCYLSKVNIYTVYTYINEPNMG